MAHSKFLNYQPCADEEGGHTILNQRMQPRGLWRCEQYSGRPVGADGHRRPLWRLLSPLKRCLLLFNNLNVAAPLLMVFLWHSTKGFGLGWGKTYLLFSTNAWTPGCCQWAVQELPSVCYPKWRIWDCWKTRGLSYLHWAFRLNGGMEEIIHKEQIYFVLDSTIIDNLFLVHDLIDLSKF